MRFLLHSKRSTEKVSRRVRGAINGNIGAAGTSNKRKENPGSASSSSSSSNSCIGSSNFEKNDTTRLWGQQCSPNCGCVVRFEAVVDDSSSYNNGQSILSAVYRAKQIVTVPQRRHQQQRSDSSSPVPPLQAVLTSKGRPMMKECKCQTVHQLSEAVCDFMKGKNLQTFKSTQLEFASNRSSVSFQKAVLQEQQLPANTTHCFDVVEEALTAMCKGYLPKPRRATIPLTIQAKEEEEEDRRRQEYIEKEGGMDHISAAFSNLHNTAVPLNSYDGDDEDEDSMLPFGRVWKNDWETYVDAMNYQEKDRPMSST